MDFAEQAHQVVDGVMAGDVKAISLALGWICLTLASSWLVTKTTKYAAKQSYRGAKWLLVPKPMSELAQELLDALENGKPELYGADLALGGKKVVFWSNSNKWRAKLASACAYDPCHDTKDAKTTSVCDKLTRREKKKILKQATLIRNRLQDECEARDAEQSWIKALDIVGSINEPKQDRTTFGGKLIAVGDDGCPDNCVEDAPKPRSNASGLGKALNAMTGKEQPKELKSMDPNYKQCTCKTCTEARARCNA